MTLSPPPVMGHKEARNTIGVNDRLFAEITRRGVLASVNPPDGGSRLYRRADVERLAHAVAGVRYGRRRILLGVGRALRTAA